MEPLRHEDALTLFSYFALPKDNNSSYVPDESLIQEVVKACRGSPLVIQVIGRSLCQQPYDVWQKMVNSWSQGHSILDLDTNLLNFLQKGFDVLVDKSNVKECFMDLGLFPEDQKIPVTALIDMWTVLYDLDDEGVEAMNIIYRLTSRNLANLLITRKVESNTDNFYNNHFIMQHDLLRELAIYQSSQEPFEQRKRLIVDINENNHRWSLKEKQQGVIACISSALLKCCAKLKQQHVIARTLSISTDETFTSDFCDMEPTETKVMILNVRTKEYSLPAFIEKMRKLMVLLLTNYGFHTTELKNFHLLGSLPNLKRIRLEKVSVPSLGTLKNLRKLSLYMCNTSEAFEESTMPISDALPNLVELNIDYCKDIVKLPNGICGIKPLKKLSISNCHKFSALPQDIGNLDNLEVMRLNSCTDLEVIPDSIGKLNKLRFLDISNCISLRNLPEDIGNLKNLGVVYMTGCSRCELPMSVAYLEHLKSVTCDEETAASWEVLKPMLPNLRIVVPQVDVNLNWLLGTRDS
ncbi:putative disease resistance protein [Senna tora]|uniref:Putative disease resistance protein n=1 Tax=Senna tora TaxID=362788 RepID=A0A834TZ74_9FABA|nr:putative disease resistance protein [Senna tora]